MFLQGLTLGKRSFTLKTAKIEHQVSLKILQGLLFHSIDLFELWLEQHCAAGAADCGEVAQAQQRAAALATGSNLLQVLFPPGAVNHSVQRLCALLNGLNNLICQQFLVYKCFIVVKKTSKFSH